jgi:phenylacetic acid degradation operon negative regulatory protein
MEITAKSLALDLLSTVRGRSMPVSAIIAAAEVFGIESNGIRVALARCLAKGTVERDERGEYRLGPARADVQSQLSSWRRFADKTRRWSGTWLAVHHAAIARSERAAVRSTDRALQCLGFAAFERELSIRPDNLKGGIDRVRERLVELGLDGRATVFEMSGLDSAAGDRAESLWNTDEIVAGYRRTSDSIRKSETKLAGLSESDAMVESFIVGGRALRTLALDPLLPPPMIAEGELAAVVSTVKEYDKLGRAVWRPFLERHGVRLDNAPANFAATGRLERPFQAGDLR